MGHFHCGRRCVAREVTRVPAAKVRLRDAAARHLGSKSGYGAVIGEEYGAFMKWVTVALLFVCSCSILRAQECTVPADQYIGLDAGDGRCRPWPKKPEKLVLHGTPCTPELKGRLQEPLVPERVNGVLTGAKECVPIEWLRRFDPPRWMLDGSEQSADELKDDVDRLKSRRP